MANTTNHLLQKVKNSVLLRETDSEEYKASFAQPQSFITATINGQQEFVPISLLCKIYDRYNTLLELHQVFREPETNSGLDMRLKEFYELHQIEWPGSLDTEIIGYYIKPKEVSSEKSHFQATIIEKLSGYAGTRYKASDAFLKDLGSSYADNIVDTTNTWAQKLKLPEGYIVEPERYWQVAGRFKSFTWAKIYKEEDAEKKIFFSVGVDVLNKQLEIKLDVLRSGTHKLSNFEIRDFDYFTQGKKLSLEYALEEISDLSLESLTFIANQFIKDHQSTYELAIDFIWNDTVDCSLFENKLFKLSKDYRSEVEPTLDSIIENDIAQLIIAYEKHKLTHAGRSDIAENIKIEHEGGLKLIRSFETDSKPCTILYKASTGGTTAPLEMSREEIEYLGDNLHTYLYHVVEYEINNRSGKLIIRKGSPTQYAELRSLNFEVKIDQDAIN